MTTIMFDISPTKLLGIITFSVGLLVTALSTVAWHLDKSLCSLQDAIVSLQ